MRANPAGSLPCKARFAGAALASLMIATLPSAAFAQAAPSADPLAGKVGKTVAETHAPTWPTLPRAPRGAPNVIVILTDDVGFGVSSTFGGPVPTPTMDALAQRGLRYNRFNTTALCSPTRAALLTGHIPQNVNMGNVSNLPTGFDGYTTVIPKDSATIAEVLKENGYNTAMFGKGHITPEWEMSPAGPYDRWPTGLGFEYFYGFLSADTSMWNPAIVENTRPVEAPHDDPSYFFEKDMADHAIRWLREQKAAAPGKPFFIYYAPGLAHTPHHAPKEWLEKFRGRFDAGWDKLREETWRRQKRDGVIPADAKLTPRPDALKAWDSFDAEHKRVYARLAEAYAASVAYSDAQTGRVIDAIRQLGQLDNTLVIYIQGDNGASAEGGPDGLSYEQSKITGRSEPFSELSGNIDKIGGPLLYNHMPAAFAWAFNAPFPWWKQIASQAGGVRNGMVVSWPAKIAGSGLRSQYAHVSDVMPTILEATGVAMPDAVGGVKQKPLDGISFAYSFNAPAGPSARRQQIYEMMENFGIYKDGWMAGTLPKRAAWDATPTADRKTSIGPDQRQWTLFDMDHDFSTAVDLAKAQPDRLKAMQELFWSEARKNNILPIHDYGQGVEGKPSLGAGRREFTYWPGLTRMNEDAAPHTIGHSFSISARVDLPSAAEHGVLITQGGRFGGWAFYLKDGKPVFHYNAVGLDQFKVAAAAPVAPGKHLLTAEFAADAPKPGTGGTMTLSVDGVAVASGRIGRTVMSWISHTEGMDVGEDTVTPINGDYTIAGSRFSGRLDTVTVTIR
ncbi:MAG: arylsulfatase [Sphingomonadales bacterium]|nr:arylsulfatase [Sphingomonadales bacterium]